MNNKSCLIIIDVQKGIFKLKYPVYDADRFIENIKKKSAWQKKIISKLSILNMRIKPFSEKVQQIGKL